MAEQTTGGGRRPRGIGRRLVIVALALIGAVFVLLVAGVLAGPALVGSYLSGRVFALQDASLDARVRVKRLDLTWTGPQAIESVTVLDEQTGETVADLSLEATTDLLSLLLGGTDLGRITVRGEANLVGDESGAPRIYAPGAPGNGRSAGAAPALGERDIERISRYKGELSLDALRVTYRTPGIDRRLGETVGVESLNGRFTLEDASLLVDVQGEPIGGGALRVQGRLSASSDAFVTGDVSATLAIRGQRWNAIAGDWLEPMAEAGSLRLGASASRGADADAPLTATLEVSAEGDAEESPVRASASLRADADGVRLEREAAFSVRPGPRLLEVAGLRGDEIRVERAKDVSASIASFSAAWRDASNWLEGVDLRTIAVESSARIGSLAGSISLPNEPGARRLGAEALTFSVSSDRLGESARITGDAGATLDDEPAGTLDLDATLRGLITSGGSINRTPRFEGRATLTGLSTTLAQSLAPESPLSLREDLGPSIDLRLTGASAGSATNVDLEASARNFSARTAVRIARDEIASRDAETSLRLERAAPLLDRLGAGVRIEDAPGSGDGATSLEARLDRFNVPIEEGRPNWRRASFGGVAGLRPLRLTPETSGAQEPVLVGALRLTASTDARGPVEWAIDRADDDEETPGAIGVSGDGTIELAWSGEGALDLARTLPSGALRVRSVPPSLIGAYLPTGEDRRLATEALGGDVDITIEGRAAETTPRVWEARARLRAPNVRAEAEGRGEPGASVRLERAEAEATLTPSLAAGVANRFAPDLEGAARLTETSVLRVEASPVEIDLGAPSGTGLLERLSGATVTLRAPEPIRLARIDLGGESAGEVELGSLSAEARIEPGGTPSLHVSAALREPGGDRRPIGDLRGEATFGEPLAGRLVLSNADAAALERLLGRPDLIEPITGSPLTLRAGLTPTRAEGQTRALRVGVDAPRLSTEADLRVLEDRIASAAPFEARMTIRPAFLNARLAAISTDEERDVGVVGPTDATLRVERFVIGRGDAPLAPDIFSLDASLSSPRLRLRTEDGRTFFYDSISASVRSAATPGRVDFGARLLDPSRREVALDGLIEQIADSAGRLTAGSALVSATVTGAFPETLVDAVLDAGGRLSEATGSNATVEARLERFGDGQGGVDVRIESDRAVASVRGELRGDTFFTSEPARVELRSFSPELGEMVFEQVLPLLGRIEKRPEDGPAFLEARDLTIPVDADLRHLNGDVTIELGRVRYEASRFFGRLLRLTDNRAQSVLFREWAPLEVDFDRGVATYERVSLPIGEFDLQTEGKVDLVNQRVDVVTYVPLSAVEDDIRQTVGRIPGLGRLTTIPLRTSGSFGSLRTEPAPDLLLKEGANAPGRIIEDVLEGIFGEKRKKQRDRRRR